MKFTCDKSVLVSAVNNVSRAVTARNTMPALEGILIKGTDSFLHLTGFDLEMGITTEVPAKISEGGSIVLSAKLLGDIIRKAPGDSILFEVDEKMLTLIKSGATEYTILGMNPADYPELPTLSECDSFSVEQATLKSMIDQTLFAIATNDSKPVHTGSMFEVSKESLAIISVDGYRMAVRRETVKAGIETKFVVPGKTLSEISKLLKEDGEDEDLKPAVISASRKHVLLRIGNYSVVSRLLDGEFLDYGAAVPKGFATEVFALTRDLINTVERTSLLISDRLKSPLRVRFEDDMVYISCSTALGKVHDEISCEIKGDAVEMGFNNKYVLDALRAADCDKLRLHINGPLSPMKVIPAEGDSFLFLVLPVRLKGE